MSSLPEASRKQYYSRPVTITERAERCRWPWGRILCGRPGGLPRPFIPFQDHLASTGAEPAIAGREWGLLKVSEALAWVGATRLSQTGQVAVIRAVEVKQSVDRDVGSVDAVVFETRMYLVC